jgi:CRP-like cAMP-binding protein
LFKGIDGKSGGGGWVHTLELVKGKTEPRFQTGRSEADDLFDGLPHEARSALESLAVLSHCSGDTVLFTGVQPLSSVLFLLERRVKLSLERKGGRRIALEVFGSGRILGLTSALSGCANGITAETKCQCFIASIDRETFLDFLIRYPAACQNAARILCREYYRFSDRLHSFSFSLPTSA